MHRSPAFAVASPPVCGAATLLREFSRVDYIVAVLSLSGNDDTFAGFIWPGTLDRLPDICISEVTEDFIEAANSVPSCPHQMICDSGATSVMSFFGDEFDNRRDTDIRWNSASSSDLPCEFEGEYRLFLPDPDKNVLYFSHVYGLCVKHLGNVELCGVVQLNKQGIGFTSPPWTWGPQWPPHLFRGNSPRDVQVFYNCWVAANGLPMLPNCHTKGAVHLVCQQGYILKDLVTGNTLVPHEVLPHIFGVESPRSLFVSAADDIDSYLLSLGRGMAQGESCSMAALNATTGVNPMPSMSEIIDSIPDDKRAELFVHALENGEPATAFKLLKGKQHAVHLWSSRLIHPSSDMLERIIQGTTGHGLRRDDVRLLLPSLARMQTTLRATRRVRRSKSATVHAAFTAWSLDIQYWPVYSWPHGFRYVAVFVERIHKWG